MALERQFAQVAADLGPAVATAGRDELLTSVTEVAALAFDARACSIALLDENAGELEFVAASGEEGAEIIGVRMPATRGIAGWCAASGQVIAVEDVAADQRFARDVAEKSGYMPSSILAAPIESDDDVLGVLEVLDRADRVHDMELAGALARHAALVLSVSAAEGDLARVLFRAAAGAAGGDLAASLRQLSDASPGPTADLSELAAAFAALGRLGPGERAAATRLVTHFLEYATGHRR